MSEQHALVNELTSVADKLVNLNLEEFRTPELKQKLDEISGQMLALASRVQTELAQAGVTRAQPPAQMPPDERHAQQTPVQTTPSPPQPEPPAHEGRIPAQDRPQGDPRSSRSSIKG